MSLMDYIEQHEKKLIENDDLVRSEIEKLRFNEAIKVKFTDGVDGETEWMEVSPENGPALIEFIKQFTVGE